MERLKILVVDDESRGQKEQEAQENAQEEQLSLIHI